MQFVTGEGMQLLANAFLITMVTHLMNADQSVSPMLTVPRVSSAETHIVLTHALVSVAPMPTAKCQTIFLSVPVAKDTQETHSLLARDLLLHVRPCLRQLRDTYCMSSHLLFLFSVRIFKG